MLLALTISLSLPMDGSWQLNVSPVVGIPNDFVLGVSLPGIVLYSPDVLTTDEYRDMFLREELNHERQQQALGMWFWVVYGLTGGNAFEPHNPLSVETPNYWDMDDRVKYDKAIGAMWVPTLEQQSYFPFIRLSGNAAGVERLELLPGYVEGVRILWELLN